MTAKIIAYAAQLIKARWMHKPPPTPAGGGLGLIFVKRYSSSIVAAGLDKEINQYYAALTNMRSVGVMGDERTYDYAVALRAVTTTDFMTAESYNMPWDVLGTVTSRIVNEVKHVNRVFYDCTGKPPATIELE